MALINRYITDQAKTYVANCQDEEQYQETTNFHAMLHFTSNALILSELSEISIRGSSNFRMDDETATVMVGGILTSKISLTSLVLTHHRIMDIGMIQICRLILVSVHMEIFVTMKFIYTSSQPSDADVSALQELDLEGNDIGAIGK